MRARALVRALGHWPRRHVGPFRSAAAQASGPLLVSPSGAPLTSASSEREVELTAENAPQVLQSGSPFLLLVGELESQVAKKIAGLRKAAQGRLPLVKLNCSTLPQVCQALQIVSSPTVLLMAKGQALHCLLSLAFSCFQLLLQVVAGLERDISAPAATSFVENVAQMLGLKAFNDTAHCRSFFLH